MSARLQLKRPSPPLLHLRFSIFRREIAFNYGTTSEQEHEFRHVLLQAYDAAHAGFSV